jgi:hypothetical protein
VAQGRDGRDYLISEAGPEWSAIRPVRPLLSAASPEISPTASCFVDSRRDGEDLDANSI